MFWYFIKRLVIIAPTLLVISSITFLLSQVTDKDIVSNVLGRSGIYVDQDNMDVYAKEYIKIAKQYNKNKPYFYFSIAPAAYPSTLNVLPFSEQRETASIWLKDGYSWSSIEAKLSGNIYINPENTSGLLASTSSFIPKVYWHGCDNQYHVWLSNMLGFDFGQSIRDGRSVGQIIKEALPWTMTMSLLAIALSGLVAIPLGAKLASMKNSKLEKTITTSLYLLYAIPSFWLATLFVLFFTTDEYGSWLNIFPSIGINPGYYESTLTTIWYSLGHLILPIFCLCLHSLAYDIAQVKSSMKAQLSQEYIVTAYAKGLPSNKVRIQHALRNALIPIITLVVASIPIVISGSLVLEIIFNIPGMGRLLLQSIAEADWPVVYGVIMLSSFIALISYLIGDILYVWANPKISLKQ